ncbi:hypothetical protein E4T38_02862 [Aureobasidium subglaciale]|nr:hypothetical protein E4T38_02862 [Aureobasidium subglaciale]KAI5227195.1 hypothetical protein E4T40_02701 [Aureobasidium subglaciale]KAI5230520.1 hypothetical protein E4T41_02861 [Aureobasidium subglaciale]KAI5264877.1 hypothetical protein E4T46_02639 [Aureobasidium subglaciale]
MSSPAPSSPGPAPYPSNALSMRDTILPQDLPRFLAFLSKDRGGDIFEGYNLNDNDTNEVLERETFEDNGNAKKYLEQEEKLFEENKRSGWWVAPEGYEEEMEEKDRKVREKGEERKKEEEKNAEVKK